MSNIRPALTDLFDIGEDWVEKHLGGLHKELNDDVYHQYKRTTEGDLFYFEESIFNQFTTEEYLSEKEILLMNSVMHPHFYRNTKIKTLNSFPYK